MEGESQYPESFKRFLKTAKAVTGWEETRIREELRKEFPSFQSNKMSEYLDHLSRVMESEWSLERELAKHMSPRCPICGSETKGDLEWYGKHTKQPGWTCVEGGIRHFIEAKVNNICRLRGQEIQFPEVEVSDEEGVRDDSKGDAESGRSGHAEHSRAHIDMGVQTEGISSGPPARGEWQES